MEKSKVRQEHNRSLSSRNEPGWRKVGEENLEERGKGARSQHRILGLETNTGKEEGALPGQQRAEAETGHPLGR